MHKPQHNMIRVAPVDGRLVRYPAGHVKAGQVIPEGARVRLDSYIARRLACGDLTEFKDATAPTPKAKAPKKAQEQEG